MELEKQKEVRSLYKMKLERTQDYLRHCLQVAQDNGFLDLIIGNKSKQQESLLSSPATIISNGMINNPQINNPPVHDHSDLAALVEQAKMQGWYIQPNEVGSSRNALIVLGIFIEYKGCSPLLERF